MTTNMTKQVMQQALDALLGYKPQSRTHAEDQGSAIAALREAIAAHEIAALKAAQPVHQEPEWVDDPHDIEQGMMRNPKWKPAPVAPYQVTDEDVQTVLDVYWAPGNSTVNGETMRRALEAYEARKATA